MDKLKPLKIDANSEYVVAKIIKTITMSKKKAAKRSEKIAEALIKILNDRMIQTDDAKEIVALNKTVVAIGGALSFIEETCMGLRFPGNWLDFDENGCGKYAAAFGILFTRRNDTLNIDIGCKIAVSSDEAVTSKSLPMFYNFEQRYPI